MKRKMRIAPLVLCLTLGMAAVACGDDDSSTDASGGDAGGSGSEESVKIGFITKFPVDFYDTMVDAVKQYDSQQADVEVLFGQGKSGTDDEGEIAIIEDMVVKGVKAIAVTPTSPNVQDTLQEAVDAGIVVVLVDNDIPGWDGKTSLVATDNLAGGQLAGEFMVDQLAPGAGRRVRRRAWRRLRDRRLAADRLRPDQGPRRRPGHPDRQPRRDRHLRRLRPADHRGPRGDRERRQDHQGGRFRCGPR